MQKQLLTIVMLLVIWMINAQSATVVNTDGATGCSQLDLLQQHLSSTITTGNFNQSSTAGALALINGTAPTNIYYEKSVALSLITSNSNILYTLDTSGNQAAGDSLSTIDIYHGWSDEGRDQGKVTISFATVAAPMTFVEIVNSSNAVYDPTINFFGRMRVTPSSGTMIDYPS